MQKLFRKWVGADTDNLSELYGQKTRAFYQSVFLSDLCRSLLSIIVVSSAGFMLTGELFFSTQAKIRLLPILIAMGSFFWLSCWLVENGYRKVSRRVMLIACTGGCVLTVIIFGGFSRSVATPILMAPIIIAFCIARQFEVKLTCLFNGLFPPAFEAVAYVSGWSIPDYSSDVSPAANTLFLMVVLFAVVYISLAFLQRTNVELHKALKKEKLLFQKWAEEDGLTGLGNRRRFDTKLSEVRERAEKTLKDFAVIYLDLSDFKSINDEFGHVTGDSVLAEVASRLKSAIRQDDFVARLGGDEFGIILEDLNKPSDLTYLKDKIRGSISRPMKVSGLELNIDAGIGDAHYHVGGKDGDKLMQIADASMYQDKMDRKSKRSRSPHHHHEVAA